MAAECSDCISEGLYHETFPSVEKGQANPGHAAPLFQRNRFPVCNLWMSLHHMPINGDFLKEFFCDLTLRKLLDMCTEDLPTA
jgi:hypothetical protein